MQEFFQMGGHAFFVWSSYAIVAVLFVLSMWLPASHHRKLIQQLANEQAAND